MTAGKATKTRETSLYKAVAVNGLTTVFRAGGGVATCVGRQAGAKHSEDGLFKETVHLLYCAEYFLSFFNDDFIILMP